MRWASRDTPNMANEASSTATVTVLSPVQDGTSQAPTRGISAQSATMINACTACSRNTAAAATNTSVAVQSPAVPGMLARPSTTNPTSKIPARRDGIGRRCSRRLRAHWKSST
ncbi:hypothetical protein [Micromonospora sp. WMMD710]|uniref:hypothetical protein n=1 Tax=Micromonospora sp. WMMD710 TaxID=3016085 RepID=UPI002416C1F7|nr:hypothetical protein [Micromonospora sp. WMMD710]MDG4756674.1 hypothetical protein [Micromonospora sp. WMMD710]